MKRGRPLKKEPRLLQIGILGCGPIAQAAHFDACRKARNAELFAICDAADDLRSQLAVIWKPKEVYSRYEAMLADERLEAVIIAVADQFHVTLAIQALAAGKHVLVEKPMGVSVEECLRLQQCVRESGLTLQVGNNRRFDPGMVFAKQCLERELGQRLALKASYYDSNFRYTMTDNLQPIMQTSSMAVRPGGNPRSDRQSYYLLGHGSHLVDTARYLGGEIASLRARTLERKGAFCWFIETDFADRSLGHLELIIPVCGDYEERFHVICEHGNVNGRLHLPWYHKAGDVECFLKKDGAFHRPLGADAHTYKLQIEGFADSILHGKPMHGATVDDGVAAVQAMVAIKQSAQTGQSVLLSDVKGSI
jgi:predicted dehydrogenase